MGGKQRLISAGLGELILKASDDRRRFVDLFSGSGVVSRYVAENVNIPVWSNDFQRFSSILALAVTMRDEYVEPSGLVDPAKTISERLALSGASGGPQGSWP